MKIIVTTSQSGVNVDNSLEIFVQASGLEYVKRAGKSLRKLQAEHQADGVIVWLENGPVLHCNDDKFFFHPSMAKNRLSNYRHSGKQDSLVIACDLQNGDDFLDCTLGLGADSIVAAYFTPSGRVVALESSPVIALIIKYGMQNYNSQMSWLDKAIHQVTIKNREHYEYLKQAPDNSYDIVYFDPMFREPNYNSQPISVFRHWANPAPLSLETIKEACRVARKRVVIKEKRASGEFERLGFNTIMGSKYNPIAYGVIAI